MQHFLKPASGTTRTEVIPAELFEQFLFAAADRSVAALHASFAQGTPGDAWTFAQKEWIGCWVFLRAMRASC
jgi:hypothetical protein